MTSIKLWENSKIESSLVPFLLNDGKQHPAILIIPGGGYGCVCENTEGSPIAKKFNSLGFNAFVLNYRVAPHRYPLPQLDAIRAMQLIRHNASRWFVLADNIAVCGFSAGAHLSACLGTIADKIERSLHDEIDGIDYRPNAMILSYGALSFAPWSNQETVKNLLNENVQELRDQCSLEKQISPDTPPAFIWHTVEDQMAGYRNSIVFAEAMWNMKCLCELHLFPSGPHGMQLGYGRQDIAVWPEQAKSFLRISCGFRFSEALKKRTVVLTFDDAVKSHLTNVAPILKKYGFGATFFICRFNEQWRAQHAANLLSRDDIKSLADMGFEIGNHTVNHQNLQQCSDSECNAEIADMNDFLQSCGVRHVASFAYPGGPFAENAVSALKRNGIKIARTTEARAWEKQQTSSWRIPSFSLQGDNELAFYQAISNCQEHNAVVLVFHGIPDLVHNHVSNSPIFFEKCMKYLYDNEYIVINLSAF